MITVYRWNPERRCGDWVGSEVLEKEAATLKDCGDVLWIDLEDPTPEEEERVFRKFFPVHALSLEDIAFIRRHPGEPPHLAKVEEFPDYLFVIVNPLNPILVEDNSLDLAEIRRIKGPMATQLSAVLTQTMLITHHALPLKSVTHLKGYLQRHHTQAERGPDFLFHLVLDETVDEYAPVLDRIGELLDRCETQVFRKPTQSLLGRMLHLKRRTIGLRKTLVLEREVLARLCRGEFRLIDDRETVYYRNVYDHLIRYTELVEAAREMATDLMQTHLAAMSNRLNEVMKVLTMISTIVLPMTLIAGVYGMNFEENILPSFQWAGGFVFALTLMILTGAVAFGLFKWRKWV
jgi:magnesium transporter